MSHTMQVALEAVTECAVWHHKFQEGEHLIHYLNINLRSSLWLRGCRGHAILPALGYRGEGSWTDITRNTDKAAGDDRMLGGLQWDSLSCCLSLWRREEEKRREGKRREEKKRGRERESEIDREIKREKEREREREREREEKGRQEKRREEERREKKRREGKRRNEVWGTT